MVLSVLVLMYGFLLYSDRSNLRFRFSEKATYQMIFGRNCETATTKKPEARTKADFLFERASILSKKQLVKLAHKVRKS